MIVSNNENTFIRKKESRNSSNFNTANEKLCEYGIFFGEKSKNWDKLIQSGTLGQHTKNRDSPGKTGTVRMFAIVYHSLLLFWELFQR